MTASKQQSEAFYQWLAKQQRGYPLPMYGNNHNHRLIAHFIGPVWHKEVTLPTEPLSCSPKWHPGI
ncbi:MAG: hypothetical protein GY943_08360 [Chloroflexi bacterium]|nr:hypothetical protein [Chloroflexota bacterium]